MLAYFCEKFKNLRKARDLTQDQVAEIFHVSPQSVSRWETGVNFPDIELLPHIACFFSVTVDELLGTERIVGEQKAKEYLRDIRYLLNSGKLHEGIEAARKAVREIPTNYELQSQLLRALCCYDAEKHEPAGDAENLREEIIKIGERIVKYCTDQVIAPDAKYVLFNQYVKWGMKEEARRILWTMTAEVWHTQDVMAGELLEGEEWRGNQHLRIVRFKNLLCQFILGYAFEEDLNPLQKIERLKAMIQVECVVDSITGEPTDLVSNAFNHMRIASFYCDVGDAENTLSYVEQATQDSMSHIELMYQPDEHGNNYMAWATPRNLCWILWEDFLMKPCFDPVRGNDRFIHCLERLKANSQEQKQTTSPV
ncbi:MAG: helix-turn-helix domain-containing protein [Defluviitaleaceae bacterium]|nr:helix-turn-helix domain-containing protein [Defluviitaleaceae bacterium]